MEAPAGGLGGARGHVVQVRGSGPPEKHPVVAALSEGVPRIFALLINQHMPSSALLNNYPSGFLGESWKRVFKLHLKTKGSGESAFAGGALTPGEHFGPRNVHGHVLMGNRMMKLEMAQGLGSKPLEDTGSCCQRPVLPARSCRSHGGHGHTARGPCHSRQPGTLTVSAPNSQDLLEAE